jgi:HD-GYP domain-containing protein (c-di-GMP phosphodiesterase class II)
MLIEITAEQLRVGMYVHSLDLSWYNHPFWRRRFLINNEADLTTLLALGTRAIVIDDSKGLAPQPKHDPVPDVASPPVTLASTKLEVTPVSFKPAPKAPVPNGPDSKPIPLVGAARETEMLRASKMLHRSKTEVMTLFGNARMGKSISTRKITNLVAHISDSVTKDPSIILNVARLKTKDEYTFLHSVSVCALMINLGRKLGLDEVVVQDLGMAGMLHDLGKMTIPDLILNKPAKLDEEEWRIVRSHPEKGHAILSSAKCGTETALDVCLNHHEKMDGTGYPNKIKGEDLSLAARMAAICDVYDAITSQRSYNAPLSGAVALSKMLSWQGHFDQTLLRSFIESLGISPIGCVVELTDGKYAVVIGENPEDFSQPVVRTFYDPENEQPPMQKDIHISRETGAVQVHAIKYDLSPELQAKAQMAAGFVS